MIQHRTIKDENPNISEVYSEKPLLNSNINLILRAKRLPRVLWCLFRWCLIKANSIKWWWSSCCIIIFFQYVLMLRERMGFLWWTANVLWQLTLIVSGFRQQTVPCPATLPDRNKISVKKSPLLLLSRWQTEWISHAWPWDVWNAVFKRLVGQFFQKFHLVMM